MRMVIVLALIAALSPAAAFAQSCGFQPTPPTPPTGCRDTRPVCVCTADGNCFWQFVCVPDR